jgi:hypothetical protein
MEEAFTRAVISCQQPAPLLFWFRFWGGQVPHADLPEDWRQSLDLALNDLVRKLFLF